MKPIERLGIVGVGLIGGSFALAARAAGLAREVVGLGRGQANLDVALERGIVDRASTDPGILAGAEVVLLATPVGGLAPSARAIAASVADGAIVTDAGSVKTTIVSACSAALGSRARFVGGHPIAGTEESGAAAADAGLFRGARCVLTPVEDTDRAALAAVRALWEAVGMEVIELSPEVHDRLLATVSHVPHVLAFSLSLAAGAAPASPDPIAFAGPSFRDATRVALSSPEMWRDILVANADALDETLARFRAELDRLERAIRAHDVAALDGMLARAREVRSRLVKQESTAASVRIETARDAVTITPRAAPLSGRLDPPGDKSIAHRALIFAGVASGRSTIRGVGGGEDNAATLSVLRSLGVEIERQESVVEVVGRGFTGLRAPDGVLDCRNSGTTMRLMTGLLAARPFAATLDGDDSLRRRPMRRVIEPLGAMGAIIESREGRPPLTVHGGVLHARSFTLEVASAQVKTALVLAGLQTRGTTSVTEPALSRDHTERLLPAFGGRVNRTGALTVAVKGPQQLRPAEVSVPGDLSAAAFWLVAATIVPGSSLELGRVGVNPTRTGVLDVLRAMGADIVLREQPSIGDEPVADLGVRHAQLHGIDVQGETMLRAIDEFPVLAIAAAAAHGQTRFADGAELRVKESDRIAAVARGLERLGAAVEERRDGLIVHGPLALGGGEVESHGDHRIAMAFAVAALIASGPVTIRGAGAIDVSYPGFLDTLARLRGEPS
jgi:3-phosphoshikimate 1-carboxyvinyltransferase